MADQTFWTEAAHAAARHGSAAALSMLARLRSDKGFLAARMNPRDPAYGPANRVHELLNRVAYAEPGSPQPLVHGDQVTPAAYQAEIENCLARPEVQEIRAGGSHHPRAPELREHLDFLYQRAYPEGADNA